MNDRLCSDPAENYAHVDSVADPFAWSQSKAPRHLSNGDGDQPNPMRNINL